MLHCEFVPASAILYRLIVPHFLNPCRQITVNVQSLALTFLLSENQLYVCECFIKIIILFMLETQQIQARCRALWMLLFT